MVGKVANLLRASKILSLVLLMLLILFSFVTWAVDDPAARLLSDPPFPLLSVPSKDKMVFPEKYWIVVSPEQQGLDSAKLDRAMKYLANNCGKDGANETVIIRNGYMIWRGDDIANTHNIWSVTKAFTSTVLGLLVDDGRCAINDLAKDYVPFLAKHYPKMTLSHLATMTSGYRASKGLSRRSKDDSKEPFKPSSKPLFAPGTAYSYWNDAANMLGYVLTKIAKEPMYDLFKRRIADPIGMNSERWEWGTWGKYGGITVNGGAGNRKHGIFMSARDVARLGHLYLNRGNWNGQQLISAKWIDEATQNHVPTNIKKASPLDGRGVHGYNWWVNGIDVNGDRYMPDAPPKTYFRTGYPHNMLIVIPEWNMVIVRLGADTIFNRTNMWNNTIKMIGEAMMDKEPETKIK